MQRFFSLNVRILSHKRDPLRLKTAASFSFTLVLPNAQTWGSILQNIRTRFFDLKPTTVALPTLRRSMGLYSSPNRYEPYYCIASRHPGTKVYSAGTRFCRRHLFFGKIVLYSRCQPIHANLPMQTCLKTLPILKPLLLQAVSWLLSLPW